MFCVRTRRSRCGRGDGQMRGDAGRAPLGGARGVHHFVMIWLRRGHERCRPSDGWRVVSASKDETLKVRDVATGKCVATLEGHSRACVARRPLYFGDDLLRRRSERCRVSGRATRRVWVGQELKVWDVATGAR